MNQTNLGTGAAGSTILSSLGLQFFFLEQPFYESYPTLDSRDTRPFTRRDGFQTVIRSIVWLTAVQKLNFNIASAFSSVQFKSNTGYSVNSLF